ncbi:hypothetical protein PUN28_004072 [Cardiocondyla obscurior]|uniref:Uncharacterized protein n=1 Tax=Cardiocondyla obscurior TaxID=286306 RepID=A0AAW2GN44_9HYME
MQRRKNVFFRILVEQVSYRKRHAKAENSSINFIKENEREREGHGMGLYNRYRPCELLLHVHKVYLEQTTNEKIDYAHNTLERNILFS